MIPEFETCNCGVTQKYTHTCAAQRLPTACHPLLQAADPDEGANSVVLFTATSGDTTLFGVNPTSGAVRSLVKMVSVTATEFTLTVNATDDDGNGQSTSMKLKVIVYLF